MLVNKMAASTLKYSYCGKEYQFTSKEKSHIEKYLCAICLELLFEPLQTSCGHLFCQECLKMWRFACPTCKTVFLRPPNNDMFNGRAVNNLTVLCENTSRGCEWKGELGSVEAHHNSHCGYQLVKCPNKCGVEMQRRELEDHQEHHCEQRSIKCPYCQEKASGEHLDKCRYHPADCPNGCGTRGLVRRDIPSHIAACPDQTIPCPYKTLGCRVQLPRKEMEDHLEDKDDHLALAMGTTLDLTRHLNRIEVEHQMSIDALQLQMSLVLQETGIDLGPLPEPPNLDKPWLKTDSLPLHPPFTTKVKATGRYGKALSPSFNSHPGGYKLAVEELRILRLLGDNRKSHMKVIPIDCPENQSQKWPATITVKGVLLNQNEDAGHTDFELQTTMTYQHDKYHPYEVLEYTSSQPDCSKSYMKISNVIVHETP